MRLSCVEVCHVKTLDKPWMVLYFRNMICTVNEAYFQTIMFSNSFSLSGTPSCHVGVGNGPGIIIITAPPINKTIVESSQLEGACLTNASASFDYTRLICTSFGAVAFSPNCVSDHDPPNPWCQDNVRCVNFTRLLNDSGLFSATIQASSCDITLSLSLQVSGIHPFEVELCQHICTQLGKCTNPWQTFYG